MNEQPLSAQLKGMEYSPTVGINERSNALLAAGRNVVKLGLGQSPFPVPNVVVEALRKHAVEKDYLPVAGLPALRDSVANHLQRTTGVSRSDEDVLIAPGSKELLFLSQLVFDGAIVIPSPSWVSYQPQGAILKRPTLHPKASRKNRWLIQAEDLAKCCEENASIAKLMILNYPNNPTGTTYSDDELRELASVARKHKVVVVSDEIYGEVHHRGEHVSLARHYPEGTIVSSGLSKWCGAGGWRLGTFTFPPELSWMREAVAAVASETYTTVSAPIQYAGVTAFEKSEEIDQYLQKSRRVLLGLGTWCHEQLGQASVDTPAPEGGFYLLLDFGAHAEKFKARGIENSPQLCESILEETGVAFLPGVPFGRPAEEFTARIAYVDFDGAEALSKVGAHADETFLRETCPRVVSGIERIVDWVSSL